jgi:Family of unknown function (DUF6069)
MKPNTSTEIPGRAGIAWGRLAWATGLAIIIAVAGSAAVYLIASAVGAVDRDVVLPSLLGNGPLSLASVSVTVAVVTVAAAIVFGVLSAWTRRPVRNFRVVATVLAVLSLSSPATIPGPPAAMRIAMGTMHLVVWAVSIGVLATLARRPQESRGENIVPLQYGPVAGRG